MLDNTILSTFKDAAKKLTRHRQREFLAKVTEDYFNGSATRSNRTQFIKRMVEFSNTIGLKIRLIYYPPYLAQVQSNRAMLGCTRTLLEWHNFRFGDSGSKLVSKHDLEGN